MIVQGTAEWLNARAGSLGSSSFHEAIAKKRDGKWGASRESLMGRLAAERLTGMAVETYKSAAMKWGNMVEPEARAEYAFFKEVDIVEVGLIRHPRIFGTHCSPDGLIGDDGGVEFKCPESHTHINTLMTGKIPHAYRVQIQWHMAVTGRKWWDYVSYDPRFPAELQTFEKRILRDEAAIKEMEEQAEDFVKDLESKVAALCTARGIPIPTAEWLKEAA